MMQKVTWELDEGDLLWIIIALGNAQNKATVADRHVCADAYGRLKEAAWRAMEPVARLNWRLADARIDEKSC